MNKQTELSPASRRKFIGTLAAATGMAGMASALTPNSGIAAPMPPGNDLKNADAWFNGLKGKHRIVYDVPHPNELFPFAWPRVFLLSNMATGATEADCGVIVVLRHDAIPYAIDHKMWTKYNFGEVFHAKDPATGKPATRNPFQAPSPGEYKVPAFGEVKIGINELQASGVMFCVCDAAMSVYSAAISENMKLDAKVVKKEWDDHLLPGIQPVPSGVWALGRAQEKGCGYIFAG
jgi:intracellular sulfur oxidation DsrE/DsrF family protein